MTRINVIISQDHCSSYEAFRSMKRRCKGSELIYNSQMRIEKVNGEIFMFKTLEQLKSLRGMVCKVTWNGVTPTALEYEFAESLNR